jgi:hypothetical protein
MRASHKARLARLIATLDEAERHEVDQRCTLRLEAGMCADIRAAMERRGIAPACSRVLLNAEARVAKFADSPALQAADEAFLAAHREEPHDGSDPWQKLEEGLARIGQHYLDGSLPIFLLAPLMELWAWALAQYRLLPAVRNNGYGVSENTSMVRGIVE